MKKIFLSLLTLLILLAAFTELPVSASSKQKVSTDNLLKKNIILSMKQGNLNYKKIRLYSLKNNIYSVFGNPDNVTKEQVKNYVYSTHNYLNKSGNKISFVTLYNKNEKKYDRLIHIDMKIKNKKLKFEKFTKDIGKSYYKIKGKNYINCVYNTYLTVRIKKIDGQYYVSNIRFASLDGILE